MVGSLRNPFFRWFILGYLVILVPLRSDLGRSGWLSQFFEGYQLGSDWIYGIEGQLFRIVRFWLRSLDILRTSYCRSVRDSRISYRSQCIKGNQESEGLWMNSHFQKISLWGGPCMNSILEIVVGSGDYCSDIFEDYTWQRDRCNLMAFLCHYQFRRLLLSDLIIGCDLISILKGSDFFCPGLIWQLCDYKENDRIMSKSSLVHQLLVSLLSLCFSASISGSGCKVILGLIVGFSLVNMSQSSMLGKQAVEKSLGAVVSKLRIKIPSFDNSALIKGYAKTLIGRCMNPRLQDMKSLLFIFPRIWQMEGRVVGADLGLGRFQFDFDNEEDIIEVLKMAPLHFDYWMVSLVRWEPTVEPAYPSALKFWIRVLGVPLQFWADPTFRSIGDAIGKVVDVDIDGGRVQVILDGFQPLCFDTMIEFANGEETLVSLRYEKLYGYCSFCFSMCHDVEFCEKKHGAIKPALGQQMGGSSGESQSMSYKTAVTHDKLPTSGSEGKGKGVMSGKDRDEGRKVPTDTNAGPWRGHNGRFHQGDTSSRYRRFTNYAQFNEHRHRMTKAKEAKEVTNTKMVPRTEGTQGQIPAPSPKKLVRKALDFEAAGPSAAGQTMAALDLNEETKQAEVVEEETPSDQVLHQTNLELGEIAPVDTGSSSEVGLEERQGVVVGNDEDTAMKELNQAAAPSEVLPGVDLDQAEGTLELQDPDNSETLPEGDNGEIGVDSELCNIGPEAELEEVSENDNGKEAHLGKKKNGKGTMVLPGANSRKRNVQRLATPRKRPTPKEGASMGDTANPKNQDKEKGNPGGTKPPKPAA